MKYRLKRDLPYVKAGALVEISFEDIVVNPGKDEWLIGYTDDLDVLISEGWIEEVKPREWYVLQTPNGYITSLYDSEDILKTFSFYNSSDVIKVREIIE